MLDMAIEDEQVDLDPAIETQEEQIVETDTTNIQPRASVSYNTTSAFYYGYALGDHEQNYIFRRSSLDCTNFVSQCVWAGYGGTDGYDIFTIPATGGENNATAVALRARVSSDYRQVPGSSGWWGRNYDSDLGDPPASFCGVEEFCAWVRSNTGNGPKATVYNDGNVYSNLSTTIRTGDVLQFYASNRWYHSVIVVSIGSFAVSDYKSVLVAQHSIDSFSRPLGDLITNFGGSSCKMRLLRFSATTF